MFIPSKFQGMKKSTQQSWSKETGDMIKEVDWIQDGFNYLGENSIRVQYGVLLVSATPTEVTFQDSEIHGSYWNGFHYNSASKMSVAEFMNSGNTQKYPDIVEWLVGIGAVV